MNSCWAALVEEAIDSYRGEIAGYTREAYLVMPHWPPSGVGSYVGPLGLLLGCHDWHIGLTENDAKIKITRINPERTSLRHDSTGTVAVVTATAVKGQRGRTV
jgi:hypothetical protein